ncbi:probable 2-oxoglutarate-dependent dioxygenase ANS [Coffea eugenioides]|uniref:probable 2-oxoglutarate-dependent dioxygenase ANS n=1 Tax=Coffea eugenioides TaxID=49369 RepID=UPI000F60A877|nr:probable 2-oxoglutarate-dependent dioxygenase ANS [Coffea eugenioides]
MADALKPDELAINSNVFPQKPTIKGIESINNATFPLLQIPIVNIGILNSSLSSEVEVELRKLCSALGSSGYFQAINHGMSTSFLDEVLEITRAFFNLPLEEKQKYPRVSIELEGYGNNTHKNYQTLGWNERLHLNVLPETARNSGKWPQSPENFRRVLLEYTEKLRVMNEIILKAMAKSLNLEENCLLNQFGENPRAVFGFNFYPPCPLMPDVFYAATPHSDASMTSFILQDKEVEGLQVLKNNQWHRTPLTPDAIVVNVGDQVEIMSNGIFRSPVHRVPTNNKRERISLAVFFGPEPSIEIKPAEGLIDDKNPRLYKNVIDYPQHYRENIQHGITSPLDALKI